VGLIVLVIVGVGGYFAYPKLAPLVLGETFTMQSQPTLVVDHYAFGTLQIVANTGGNDIKVNKVSLNSHYTQDKSANSLTIDMSNNIDLASIIITVPAHTNLKLSAPTVMVYGVTGQMQIVDSRNTTILQSTLTGQSSLSGSLIFQGSIDPQATCKISENSGSVDMTLPKDEAFHVDIVGIMGPISSNYPTIEAHANASMMDAVHADVGKGQRATLSLQVNDTVLVFEGV
jgi:hypothetical protein